jgi:tetratricopeptide (TPR) repeat protein
LTANAEYLSSHSANETSAKKREKHSSAMGKDQAIKLASRNKDEGNDLFKHGTVTDAMNRYLRAINILAQVKRNECTGDEKSFVDSIALACNLNTAQCVIRMTAEPSSNLTQDERYGLLKRGIACADSALAIDPVNSKAKYRKAVCLERMKETEKAKQVIDEAMRENPDDDDLKKLYDSIVASLKEQQSKAKKFFSKMFQ